MRQKNSLRSHSSQHPPFARMLLRYVTPFTYNTKYTSDSVCTRSGSWHHRSAQLCERGVSGYLADYTPSTVQPRNPLVGARALNVQLLGFEADLHFPHPRSRSRTPADCLTSASRIFMLHILLLRATSNVASPSARLGLPLAAANFLEIVDFLVTTLFGSPKRSRPRPN